MPKSISSNLNVRVNKRQREEFKKKCRGQGITVESSVSMLMKKVVDGEIGFTPIQTRLIVNQKKQR